jgi:hypothetical protein
MTATAVTTDNRAGAALENAPARRVAATADDQVLQGKDLT